MVTNPVVQLAKASPTDNVDAVISRIGYLFKFTQQSILVVDDTEQQYCTIGSLYLGNCDNYNAAFVSVTDRMTNIQFRCRIIEQLAPNTIFDPEKPLTDTIVNLLEKTAVQPLCIVVEHAQHLTSQMIQELLAFPKQFKQMQPNNHCDLLLLGNNQANQVCHQLNNSNGFDLVSISAQDGQLVVNSNNEPKTDKRIRPNVSLFAVFVAVLTLLVAASIIMLVYTAGSPSFSNLPEPKSKIVVPVIKSEDLATITTSSSISEALVTSNTNGIPANITAADGATIFHALTNIDSHTNTRVDEPQKPSLVPEPNNTVVDMLPDADSPAIDKTIDRTTAIDSNSTENKRYQLLLDFPAGYVIQFASLSNEQGAKQYINGTKISIPLHYYPKQRNGVTNFVVVSNVFSSRQAAKDALASLPLIVKSQGLWVKSSASVKQELANYLEQ